VSELIDKAVDLTVLKLQAERLADIALTTADRRAYLRAPRICAGMLRVSSYAT
jgi:hypothetical protein